MMPRLRLSLGVALCLAVVQAVRVEPINSDQQERSLDRRRLQNSTTPAVDNFRATYKGRFQALADGCEGPPPVVQAACAGTSINLVWVSDFAKLVCEESSGDLLPAGFQSGLTCRSACHDPDYQGDPDECAASLYANDGSYTTTEGPWGEIIYECQGATVDDVDTIFRYQDTGDGSCYWRLFFGNEIYHLAQLGVLCEEEVDEEASGLTNDTNIVDDNNNETITDGVWEDQNVLEEVVVSREGLSPFTFDEAYFECSLGDEAVIDFEGPTTDDVLCAVGANCGGEDCDVPFHAIHVHADVHKFDQKRCITVLNPDDADLVEEDNAATAVLLPAGNYTVRFKAGWSILFKNPEFWYDLDDIYCAMGGDFNSIESLPPVRLTCPNGSIRIVEIEDAMHAECTQTQADTLECVGDNNWQSHVNAFNTVVYECTSNSTFPTTTVTYPPNNVTCFDQIYDDLAVGQALQIGHFCLTDINQEQDISANSFDSLDGNYRYDDFYYECGNDNQYLLLDRNTGSLGDRFTCLESVPVPSPDLSLPLREVNMTTDWREDETGATVGVGPDPLCFVFEPATHELAEQEVDNANSTDASVSNVTVEP